jgi:Ca2+-binding EF-hand superfamily protein
MGQNPCKHLVEDGGRIGEAELRALLCLYDKDKNGALDYGETELFLKDLCKALNTKYDKHNVARIFNRCDKGLELLQ